MSMPVKLFAALTALILASPALAQERTVPSKALGGMPNNIQDGSRTHGSTTEADDQNFMRFTRATFDEDMGDAITSMKELQQLFQDAVTKLKTATPGTDAYFALAREATNAAYHYVWSLSDNQQNDEAVSVVAQLWPILQPYDVVAPPPAMVLPLARFHWLQSRRLQDLGDLHHRQESGRTLDLTKDLDVYPGDYVDLAGMRYTALISDDSEVGSEERHAEACSIANDIYVVRPNENSIRKLISCAIYQASVAESKGKLDDAEKVLYSARRIVDEYEKSAENQLSVGFRMRIVDIELELKGLSSYRNNMTEVNEHALKAAELFIDALSGRAYFQNQPYEVSNQFANFKDIDFSYLPQYSNKSQRTEATLDLFTRLADSVERSRAAYPNSPSYAIVAGESLARVAEIRLQNNDLVGADMASGKAEIAMDKAGLIAQLREVNESAESECRVRKTRIEVLIRLDHLDDALAAFQKFDRTCGEWVRRYPWEYYARQHVTKATWRLGAYLHSRQSYSDALPLLTYASNWGVSDASFYLADMYRVGHGVAADSLKAQSLYRLATVQSMKRFTIPTTFNTTSSPFNVYVAQYGDVTRCPSDAAPLAQTQFCAGYSGIDDQVLWVRELRGGEVSKDIVESFKKVDQLARDNNVSFPELAAYALGEAQKKSSETNNEANDKIDAKVPEPLTDAPVYVIDTAFFALDSRGAEIKEFEARVIPFIPNGGCFHWHVKVTPEHRKVEIRTVIDYPAAPAHFSISKDSVVSSDGRQFTSRKVESLSEGLITGNICQEVGDPVGQHHLEVSAGDQSLYSVDFELVPDDGFFEWNARVSADVARASN